MDPSGAGKALDPTAGVRPPPRTSCVRKLQGGPGHGPAPWMFPTSSGRLAVGGVVRARFLLLNPRGTGGGTYRSVETAPGGRCWLGRIPREPFGLAAGGGKTRGPRNKQRGGIWAFPQVLDLRPQFRGTTRWGGKKAHRGKKIVGSTWVPRVFFFQAAGRDFQGLRNGGQEGGMGGVPVPRGRGRVHPGTVVLGGGGGEKNRGKRRARGARRSKPNRWGPGGGSLTGRPGAHRPA